MAEDERGDTLPQLRRDLVISFLALVSVGIGLYAIARPTQGAGWTALEVVDLGIVLVFIVDFAWQLRKCGDWRAYLRRHWWEVPSLIPVSGPLLAALPGLSLVRGVRLLRLVQVLRLVRILGLAARLRNDLRFVGRVIRRAHVVAIILAGASVVAVGAIAVHLLESEANPRIVTWGDALWWAFNMFTNVAYVDFQPVTTGAHVLAGALELCGIAFIGVLTASLANAIFREPAPRQDEAEASPE